jgi:type VI secretion system protein ImpJ
MVYLGVPRLRAGLPAARLLSDPEPPATPVRWTEERLSIADENSGRNDQSIAVARGQWRLLFEAEDREAYDCLPVARLGRSAAGTLTLDPAYAPPALHLEAAATVAAHLRSLLEQLSAKSAALSEQRRHRTRDLVEFGSADAATFWLLNTVNAALPLVADLARTAQLHPYAAYRTLATLAGSLTTFVTEIGPGEVPPYRHDALGETFAGLVRMLGRLLGTVVPTHCINIPMERSREWMYTGRIEDASLFEKASFFLAVSGDASETDLIREVPQKSKIASPDQIDALINAALPGIPVIHTPRPPASVPVKTGTVYFRLEPGSTSWKGVQASRSLTVYLPVSFKGMRFEVLAIKE